MGQESVDHSWVGLISNVILYVSSYGIDFDGFLSQGDLNSEVLVRCGSAVPVCLQTFLHLLWAYIILTGILG